MNKTIILLFIFLTTLSVIGKSQGVTSQIISKSGADNAERLVGSLFLVQSGKYYGFYSSEGFIEEKMPIIFDKIYIDEDNAFEDIVYYTLDGKMGVASISKILNTKSFKKKDYPAPYEDLKPFESEMLYGYIRTQKNGRWGIIYYQYSKFDAESISHDKAKNKLKVEYGSETKGFDLPQPIPFNRAIDLDYDQGKRVPCFNHLMYVSKEGKWGLYDANKKQLTVGYNHTKIDDVPLIFDESGFVDKLINDPVNQDGLFIARNKKTKQWGYFQMSYDQVLIPMEYDSIQFFNFNQPFTIVMNDGKYGIFSFGLPGELLVECIYNDCKYFTEGQGVYKKYLIAVKKDNQWMWLDWYNGKILSDGYPSVDQLPEASERYFSSYYDK